MEHYHLKWNAHHQETFAAFESLLTDHVFADVVLSCRGVVLRAHRLVLSACSSYFRQTLQELGRDHPQNHPVLVFRDTSPQLLTLLLTYMYQGEVEVPSDCLRDLMELADSLDIKGLRQQSSSETSLSTLSSAVSTPIIKPRPSAGKIWNPIIGDGSESPATVSVSSPSTVPSPPPFNCVTSESLSLLANAAAVAGPAQGLAAVAAKLSGSAKRKRHLPVSNGRNKESNNNVIGAVAASMNGCDGRKAPELIPLEPPGSKIAALMNAPDFKTEGTSGEDEEPENLTVSSSRTESSYYDRESNDGETSPSEDAKPIGKARGHNKDASKATAGDSPPVGGLPADISPEYPVVYISSSLMRGRNKEGKTVHFCAECGYVSAHRGAVRRHLRTHTGEKPFQCDLCWRRFARKDHRNDHQVRCSGVQSLHRSAALLAAAAAAATSTTNAASPTGAPAGSESPGNPESSAKVEGEVF